MSSELNWLGKVEMVATRSMEHYVIVALATDDEAIRILPGPLKKLLFSFVECDHRISLEFRQVYLQGTAY